MLYYYFSELWLGSDRITIQRFGRSTEIPLSNIRMIRMKILPPLRPSYLMFEFLTEEGPDMIFKMLSPSIIYPKPMNTISKHYGIYQYIDGVFIWNLSHEYYKSIKFQN